MLTKIFFITVLLLSFFLISDAKAATFTVTKTADTNDGVCNADCSLREAITAANVDLTADTINFEIPGSGTQTLLISTALPAIDKSVTIDGTTQSGYFGVPKIELKAVGTVNYGLEVRRVFVTDILVTIRGLTINSFSLHQIYSHCATGCNLTVQGNYLGTDPTGTIPLGSAWAGIKVVPYANSTITIGGEGLFEGNLISGNVTTGPFNGMGGIHIEPAVFTGSGLGVTNVIIKGNKIGTDVTGNVDLGNGDEGIHLQERNDVNNYDETDIYAVIGGSNPAARNIISGNQHGGVSADAKSVIMKGNYIGTKSNGTQALANGDTTDGLLDFGVHLLARDGSQFVIGGDQPNEGNVISANKGYGLWLSNFWLYTGTAHLAVQGNMIGTNAAGTAALGNTSHGIILENDDDYVIDGVIGGGTDGARNVISGNGSMGIYLGHVNMGIYGNRIGTDKAGAVDLGNTDTGIYATGGANLSIGGTVSVNSQLVDGGNLISGNGKNGVVVESGMPVTIRRNKIGTNLDGTSAIANGIHGVAVSNTGTVIGSSTDAVDGNVISGNTQDGIHVEGGGTTKIFGNRIGTNGVGGSPLPNGQSGIEIQSSPDNEIGLAGNSAARNVIASNGGDGITILGAASVGNEIENNLIGTGPVFNDLGNTGNGILIGSFAAETFVGGQEGAGNTIAFNGRGVSIILGSDNEVRRNSIYSNDELGLDLFPVGVTTNDSADPDTGANRLQNFPVITRAVPTSINGTLNSTPGTQFTIDFYRADNCEASGVGEGRYYLGSTPAVTNAATGDATFSFPTSLTIGQTVVATATVLNIVGADDTSEFSQCKVVTAAPTVAFSVGSYSVNEGSASRTITVTRSGASDGATSVSYATSNGTATAGHDYAAASGTLNFSDGETIKTFDITVLSDTLDEADETVNLTLSNPTNGTGLGAQSTSVLTIIDNDPTPSLSVNSVTANEGNSGVTGFTFSVTLSAASGQNVSVFYEADGGTATPAADYGAVFGTLSFAPNEVTKIVTVPVYGDTAPEPDETFFLQLSAPVNATLAAGSGVGTIVNDDNAVPPRTAFDYDADGKADLSIFRPSNGQWWLSRSTAGVLAMTFGNATDKIVPADFTGDRKTDVAFWRPSTGEWFVLRSEDSSYYSFPFGATGDVPAPADYDGDGRADAAVFRPSTATWYISKSTGGTLIVSFGANGDVPVVDDYDGDGKADVAVFRPSNGQWWLNRSTAGVIASTFGTSTDKPVHGDFTGDGKADIGFWRPSNGDWFVLRSENSSYYSFPFGAVNDMPTAADFDGDGKVDPAVFRSASATWYVNRSSQGMLIQSFGATGDLPTPSAYIP